MWIIVRLAKQIYQIRILLLAQKIPINQPICEIEAKIKNACVKLLCVQTLFPANHIKSVINLLNHKYWLLLNKMIH